MRDMAKKRAYNEMWASENPGKMRESNRKYYSRPENKARQAAYYAERKEETRERTRQWAARNRESRRAYKREYYALNRERVRAAEQRYRARLLDACSPGVDEMQWAEIRETFCGLCAYCLKPCAKPQREHMVALSRGGRDEYSNVVPACGSCNAAKRDRTLLDWARASIR